MQQPRPSRADRAESTSCVLEASRYPAPSAAIGPSGWIDQPSMWTGTRTSSCSSTLFHGRRTRRRGHSHVGPGGVGSPLCGARSSPTIWCPVACPYASLTSMPTASLRARGPPDVDTRPARRFTSSSLDLVSLRTREAYRTASAPGAVIRHRIDPRVRADVGDVAAMSGLASMPDPWRSTCRRGTRRCPGYDPWRPAVLDARRARR